MADLFDNPMGLMGFEFVEFASPTPNVLEPLFEKMGFTHGGQAPLQGRACCTARATSTSSSTASRKSLAGYFAAEHGPRPARWRFASGTRTRPMRRALELGAQPVEMPTGPMELQPAGDQGHRRRAAVPDRPLRGRQVASTTSTSSSCRASSATPTGHGFKIIDHLTHNVYRGRMAFWGGVLRDASSTSARSATSTSRANTPA